MGLLEFARHIFDDRTRQAWPESVCGHRQNVHSAGHPRVV